MSALPRSCIYRDFGRPSAFAVRKIVIIFWYFWALVIVATTSWDSCSLKRLLKRLPSTFASVDPCENDFSCSSCSMVMELQMLRSISKYLLSFVKDVMAALICFKKLLFSMPEISLVEQRLCCA